MVQDGQGSKRANGSANLPRARVTRADAPVSAARTSSKPSEAPSAGEMPAEKVLGADELAALLERRARALARVAPAQEKGAVIHAVAFSLGGERYAIDVAFVDKIAPLKDLEPVPCTPDFVAGVVNLHGHIVAVLDLHRFLGLEAVPADQGAHVITVNAAGLEVGLLVEQVYAVQPLWVGELAPVLPTAVRVAAAYTRGVTPDMLVLLDLEALLQDERIVVRQEVG